MEQRPPSRKPKKAQRKPRKGGASGQPRADSVLPVIQARLNELYPDAAEQIAWMETLHPLFAMSPLAMIQSGREGQLLAHLEAWLQEEQQQP